MEIEIILSLTSVDTDRIVCEGDKWFPQVKGLKTC